MDIQSKKIELIQWLSELDNPDLLAKIEELKDKAQQHSAQLENQSKSPLEEFYGALSHLDVDVEEEVKKMRQEWSRREEKQWNKNT